MMKKFRIIFLFVLILGIFCSCSKSDNITDSSQSKEVEDYKTFSCKDYSLKYDDKLFTHISEDGCELFVYNNKDEILCLGGRVLGDLFALELVDIFLNTEYEGGRHQNRLDKIEKIENTTVKETVVEIEEEYEQKNYSDVSSDSSQTFNASESKCVTAFADDGERIYESHVVAFSDGVYILEYNYSTNLDQIVVENALYATVSSFTLK